jgi:hypothetical protein
MRGKCRALLLAALVLAGAVSGASAQAGVPVLLLQPGMATLDFVSSEEFASTTGFNLRFAAIVPSPSRWWTLILGASVTPYGTSGGSIRREANAPVLFIGNVFPVVSEKATDGWLSIDAPLTATYTLGGGDVNNPRQFGRDFALGLATTAHVGTKLLGSLGGPLARLRAYAILEQNLTPNPGFSGRRDHFNPVAYYGLTLPIGTSRTSP